jgi:hypothetical protein
MERFRAFTPVFDGLCGMREPRSRISQALHPGYPCRSFNAKITTMNASVIALEPISGQSGRAAP